MTYQEYVNISIGVIAFFGSFVLKEVWGGLKSLQAVDKDMIKQINKFEVLMASDYVKKGDLDKSLETIITKLTKLEDFEVMIASKYAKREDVDVMAQRLLTKLDRIENKLDNKVDKQ